jgi:hypothetical protein
MKSSRNIAVSIVVVIAIARVMFDSVARLSNVGCGVVTPTRKPHLKLLRFKESGAYSVQVRTKEGVITSLTARERTLASVTISRPAFTHHPLPGELTFEASQIQVICRLRADRSAERKQRD